ncbi:fasciclin-like arabinogalactan protein 12 [Cajanus cajan]|uniref:Fasciclin-like arabinogalactan protein 12 n=1 Tax=Cajanus cajan TaxID=3821 RepID=A0A151RVH9_CAJCA|nr:fasciclin-like arabinogalactan protein 12 [Cajanus cajan]KYP46517.1 Fasciclin-like arabinogalactan protein 12 [Cajanus cajan]
MKQTLFFFSLLLFAPIFSITTLAQSPAAAPKAPAKPAPAKPAPSTPAPAPAKPLVPALPNSPSSGPDSSASQDIVKILRKAISFNTLIRFLKTTQIINQVNAQLVTSKNGGLTILAPDDGAFSELKAGYFNSLGDRQQKALIQFHVLPVYVSSSNFDSLSNPVLTLASDSPTGYQINVTAYGNSVNISTGVVNATLTGIVYTDKTLAIYHVDKVLIPLDFSKPKAIAPAPAVAKAPKADKDSSSAEDDDQAQSSKNSSGAKSSVSTHGTTLVSFGVALLAAAATMSC